ncbi:MAG: capsid protein [Lactobacillus iners]|nr:capsid protein [Lactobacillus iners]
MKIISCLLKRHMLKIRQIKRSISNIDIDLRNPIHKESIITDELGRKSQKIIGDFTTVDINPDTMEVITTYPTKKSKRQRYLKGR